MRFWNKRRFSLWLILFLFLVIAVFNVSNWYIYSKIEFYLTQQLGERLANIASATAFGVDPSKVSTLDQDLGAYAEIKLLLDKVREDNQLADVFILNQDYINVMDPAPEYGSDVFLTLDLAAITQALAGTKTYSHLYQVGDYMFESGFAPIYDSAGHVIGVLGVEAGADFFGVLIDFRRTIILAFVLSLAGVVVLGISFYNLTSRLRKMEDVVVKNSALQAMGEMVATICHEIRNPLGIIKGTSERLRLQYQSEPNELFDFIPEEVDRLNGILTGYLEFASSEPKKKEKTDMVLLASKTAEHLKSSFSKSDIKIRLDFEEKIPLVEVNPGGIRQIVINLLKNAKEAIGQEGQIRIGLAGKGDFVLLEVEDNGKGIKKKDLAQLFNPFFSTKDKGSGLGLYVIKKIVEEHQGTITVESKLGKGTKFMITLPAVAANQSTA